MYGSRTGAIRPESRSHAGAAATGRGWTGKDIPDQTGRAVLVTGANSGLGFLTSLELARQGARVIMTARDLEKGRSAQARILAIGPKGRVDLRQLDLADLDQVKAFGERLFTEGTQVDVLVNNAGIMMPSRSLTRQGHELQFGVNHLAHFALTGLLLPQLLANRDGRVVTISSDLHKRGRIRFDDLTGSRGYGRVAFSIAGAILIAGFLLIAWQFRGTSWGRIPAWLGVVLALAFPVGIIGIYEGGYNHLLKNLLYFGGATDLVSQLFPSPAYELPNDAFFELTGIAQFVAGLVAGGYVLRLLRLRERVHAT